MADKRVIKSGQGKANFSDWITEDTPTRIARQVKRFAKDTAAFFMKESLADSLVTIDAPLHKRRKNYTVSIYLPSGNDTFIGVEIPMSELVDDFLGWYHDDPDGMLKFSGMLRKLADKVDKAASKGGA